MTESGWLSDSKVKVPCTKTLVVTNTDAGDDMLETASTILLKNLSWVLGTSGKSSCCAGCVTGAVCRSAARSLDADGHGAVLVLFIGRSFKKHSNRVSYAPSAAAELIFRWVYRINPGKTSESVTLFSNRSAQMISCVFASTVRWSFR